MFSRTFCTMAFKRKFYTIYWSHYQFCTLIVHVCKRTSVAESKYSVTNMSQTLNAYTFFFIYTLVPLWALSLYVFLSVHASFFCVHYVPMCTEPMIWKHFTVFSSFLFLLFNLLRAGIVFKWMHKRKMYAIYVKQKQWTMENMLKLNTGEIKNKNKRKVL